MIIRKCYHLGLLGRSARYLCKISSNNESAKYLCKYLKISDSKAQYMCIKYPVLEKITEEKIQNSIQCITDIGLTEDALVKEPSLFGILPITLKYRYKVLKECGFVKVTPEHLLIYLSLIKQKTVGDLKESGELPDTLNIENSLASCMTQWPTSLTSLILGDVNTFTLYSLRLKIIQRYLELLLDLSKEEFYRGIQTYPTIKHRPLETINETLTILQSVVMMPGHKIKTNLYLIHADPDNLKKIIYDFRVIGGIDIKEVIRMHPKIAMKNYSIMVEMRNVLQKYGFNKEAVTRCFEIFTLAPSTVIERLEKAKMTPEFSVFFNHPRFLKMIYYNTTATKRLMNLYGNNKKCLSLNILSGSTSHFEMFEKAPGDRLGKGKDLVFCICQSMNNKFAMRDIHKSIKRHPFWINIPVVQVKYVYQKLSTDFTAKDIFENCSILLYPWNKIKNTLSLFNNKKSQLFPYENLDLEKLNNSQKLSLILYWLEKDHYFTGNGVWTEEKSHKSTEIINSQLKTVIPDLSKDREREMKQFKFL